MSEKKENKCCGCCEKEKLNEEQLEQVTGGTRGWKDGKYICPDHKKFGNQNCNKYKTVDGIANVCVCPNLKTSKCCEQLGDSCTCHWWDKKRHECDYCVD